MTANMNIELSPRLSAQVASLAGVQPAEEDVAQAQEKLTRVLAGRATMRRVFNARWLAAAAACAAAIVAMVLPFTASSIAFADVQKHFASFKTLSFVLNTKAQGESISQMKVFVDQNKNARIETGKDITMVVSGSQQQMLMLFHGERVAMRFSTRADKPKDDPLEWINEIRTYKQAAKSLGTRKINGVSAFGWALEINGLHSELWSNEDGLPLTMTIQQKEGVTMQLDFSFDVPLEARLFSLEVPAGYTLKQGDDN
ncbi:MAG TPA: hypothetical protein VHL14_10750 [Steroidobacteraceae bacterium]|nr:hypothetical protein [Steroidobacteraceae bacterium]